MTYIAFFESYLVEGTPDELEVDYLSWIFLQRASPDDKLQAEIHALRRLYLIDDCAHFDWLCSDIAIMEVLAIRDRLKREVHRSLLERLIEHRQDG